MRESGKGNWFKKHKILTGLIVVIFIIAIASAAGGKKSNNLASINPGNKKNFPQAAKIGQAVNDGKFQFVVNSQTCGKASVGDQYLSKMAQGQYCILNITVKNIGTEAQTFDASNQYLFDAAGNRLSADSTASFYENNNNQTFLNKVNPGNSVTGNVAFDVPKDLTPNIAELHDSAFSGGIKVSLK